MFGAGKKTERLGLDEDGNVSSSVRRAPLKPQLCRLVQPPGADSLPLSLPTIASYSGHPYAASVGAWRPECASRRGTQSPPAGAAPLRRRFASTSSSPGGGRAPG